MTVSGGEVSVTGDDSYAIRSFGNVTVKGGTVSATTGCAISSSREVAVSGTNTVVSATTGYTIASSGDVTVSGGAISATNGKAIYALGDVTVSGGTVSATTGYAINSVGDLDVSGGTVFAYGTAITGKNQVIYQTGTTASFKGPTDTGIVIAWNKDAGNTLYNCNSDDLTILPTAATVFWAKHDGQSGISYTNGSNTGFIPVEGVTVNIPSVTVTFNANGGSVSTTSAQTSEGSLTSLPTPTKTNYSFDGWYTDAISGTKVTTSTVFTTDTAIFAQWTYTGGSTGGGGAGGGAPSSSSPSLTVSGSTAITTMTAKTGSDGTASAFVTQSQISSAIKAAQEAAKSNGESRRVEIQVSGTSDARAVETTMPKSAVQSIVTGEMDSLALSSSVATMTFDAQAVATIAGAASGDITFSASQVKNDTLSGAALQLVGNHPVYDFSVENNGNTISQFNGTVTISIPYTPADDENKNAIVAYYINTDGNPELMQNCYYDAEAGALIFTTTHFSTYAVGYNKVSFSDVSNTAWYADAVSFCAAREITSGTGETTFSPDLTLTRGQFMTLLMRAYGINPNDNSDDNFSDAGDTYYTGYLAAAKELGIADGVGDNMFAPEKALTRQEMFTLLYHTLKSIDQLPEGDSGKTLSNFTDSDNIAAYAQEAMAYMVKSGTVSGTNGSLLPTETTTRAQMTQVLYNLIAG